MVTVAAAEVAEAMAVAVTAGNIIAALKKTLPMTVGSVFYCLFKFYEIHYAILLTATVRRDTFLAEVFL